QERGCPVRMACAESTEDISLDNGEPLTGPVFQVLLDFLAIEPLKQQPGGIAQVEEGLAVLIDKVTPIRADLEFQALDRTLGCFRGRGCPGQAPRTEQGEKHAALDKGEKQRTRNGDYHGGVPGRRMVECRKNKLTGRGGWCGVEARRDIIPLPPRSPSFYFA